MKKSVAYQNGILIKMKKFLVIVCSVAIFFVGMNVPSALAELKDFSDLTLNGNGLYPEGYYYNGNYYPGLYPELIDSGYTLRLLPNYDINDPAHPTDGNPTLV